MFLLAIRCINVSKKMGLGEYLERYHQIKIFLWMEEPGYSMRQNLFLDSLPLKTSI